MAIEDHQTISRLRRSQPRNPDAAYVCDGFETALLKIAEQDARIAELEAMLHERVPPDCERCRANREATRDRMRALRQRTAVATAARRGRDRG
jgi:hypothetical protein